MGRDRVFFGFGWESTIVLDGKPQSSHDRTFNPRILNGFELIVSDNEQFYFLIHGRPRASAFGNIFHILSFQEDCEEGEAHCI